MSIDPDQVKTLIAYRLQQARAALDDAKCLMDAARTPSSIINRSYYAMFYAALALLQTIGKTPSKHTGALSLVDQEFVLTGRIPREAGRNLHRVFDLRQQSDYRVDPAIDDEAARIAWCQAVAFVKDVASYLTIQGFVVKQQPPPSR